MVRQCAIIFGCLGVGELLVQVTGIGLPSSILGMLLLTALLQLGWIRVEWVQGIADFFVSMLPFFFVPAGVGVMLYFDMIGTWFGAIVIAALGSTVVVLVVTGWVHQLLRKRSKTAANRNKTEN